MMHPVIMKLIFSHDTEWPDTEMEYRALRNYDNKQPVVCFLDNQENNTFACGRYFSDKTERTKNNGTAQVIKALGKVWPSERYIKWHLHPPCLLHVYPLSDLGVEILQSQLRWNHSNVMPFSEEELAIASRLLTFMVSGIQSLWKWMLATLIQNHGKLWHSCTSVGAFQYGL